MRPRALALRVFLLASCLLGMMSFPLLSGAQAAEGPVDVSEGERFFENRVRPILVEKCGECHGSEKQFGGLRVDSWQSLAEESDSAPVVVPGDVGNRSGQPLALAVAAPSFDARGNA